ncbi:MAG: hypothetical protein QOJ97_1078 [Solirubrobacteraceae bacterium]|jgi:hypothetical protein|nr:hypothetical protein [Solirubrobacteraceae bacterium]
MEPLDLHILLDASRERIRVLISDILTVAEADGDLSATSWRDMAN